MSIWDSSLSATNNNSPEPSSSTLISRVLIAQYSIIYKGEWLNWQLRRRKRPMKIYCSSSRRVQVQTEEGSSFGLDLCLLGQNGIGGQPDWLGEHKYNSPRRNSLIEFIMLQCRAHSCGHSPRSSSSTKGRYPAWSCRVKDIYVVHGATQLGAEWKKKNPSEGRQGNYYNCISVSSLLTVALIKLSLDLLDRGTRIVVVNDRSGQQ